MPRDPHYTATHDGLSERVYSSFSELLVAEMDRLLGRLHLRRDGRILNEKGFKTGDGLPLTSIAVGYVRKAYGLEEPHSRLLGTEGGRGDVGRHVLGDNGSMRKRILDTNPSHGRSNAGHGWLDLEQIATVEVTSEDPGFPIDSVFRSDNGPGWRASQKGEQQIRIIFDRPLSVHRIQLRFLEPERERTQEFTVRWSSADGGPTKEIVRQQWNFSPAGSGSEVEDYEVDLDEVSALELAIKPDLTRREAPATLASWRVA